ncbi:MAG: putative porin [Vicinamibacteria bacterium]
MSVRAALALTLLTASSAAAQDPVFQSQKKLTFQGEGLLREEWTRDFPAGTDTDRFRARALPGLRLSLGPVVLGAGGDFQWSSDENVAAAQPLIRDNYDSRDARLDLAFARLETGAVELAAGRFEMPIAFTEMVWDRDLRPQGGALTLALRDRGSLRRLAVTALGARGSHVFDDDDTTMLSAALDARFALDDAWKLDLLGAFVTFRDPGELEARIRRQNTRVAGAIVRDYDVVDAIVRLRRDGAVPVQIVADGCLNTAADDQRRGLWLSLVLGSTQSARARLEYVYAFVDRDATLAAYATDDFIWSTGWAGHKADLGFALGKHVALHGVGQVQRFKDSAIAAEREDWVRRFRLELRLKS